MMQHGTLRRKKNVSVLDATLCYTELSDETKGSVLDAMFNIQTKNSPTQHRSKIDCVVYFDYCECQ